jgi:hypothetical protein
MTDLLHPNAHHSEHAWNEEQTLHVVSVCFNPQRWTTRAELARDFRYRLRREPNVRLHFVEVSFGDRPFTITHDKHPDDIQLRTSQELWLKENALNIGIQHFPVGWKYGAYLDADFDFTRRDWALEAIHQLQHHHWVQLFAETIYLSGATIRGQGHRSIMTKPSFAKRYFESGLQPPAQKEKVVLKNGKEVVVPDAKCPNPYPYPYPDITGTKYRYPGGPGGGWAFTQHGFNAVGGLLDICICGSADIFMAYGLVGGFNHLEWSLHQYAEDYRVTIQKWQHRAFEAIQGDIGFVDTVALHHWHGPMSKRGYNQRDNILIKNEYSPTQDIYRDAQGLYQITPNKPRLRMELREYFKSRCEDIPHLD